MTEPWIKMQRAPIHVRDFNQRLDAKRGDWKQCTPSQASLRISGLELGACATATAIAQVFNDTNGEA